MELNTFVNRLREDLASKRDFLAPTRALKVEAAYRPEGAELRLQLREDILPFPLRAYAAAQMVDWAGIPRRYVTQMQERAPDLLAVNLNRWLKESGEVRLVRTLRSEVRAFLSERFRVIDNWDVAEAALQPIMQQGAQITALEVTETSMYIKAVSARVTFEVKPGDLVQAGVVVRNSEVGAGAVAVEPFLLRLVCANGMVVPDQRLRKYHVGKGSEGWLDGAQELYRKETQEAVVKAVCLQVRDTVAGAFERARFDLIAQQMSMATGERIIRPVEEAVREVTQRYNLNRELESSFLNHLVSDPGGAELTRWGLVNAVTATARDLASSDYEAAHQLERVGGDLLMLPPGRWAEIAA
jgi:hypothetical protein